MYVFVMPLCTVDGSYLPCDSGVIDFIELKRFEFEHKTWKVYNTPRSYVELQEEMAKEEAMEMAEAEALVDEIDEYYEKNKDYINRNPGFSFGNLSKPSLWTPDGEKMIH